MRAGDVPRRVCPVVAAARSARACSGSGSIRRHQTGRTDFSHAPPRRRTPLKDGLEDGARVGRLDAVPVEKCLSARRVGRPRRHGPRPVEERDRVLGSAGREVLRPRLPRGAVRDASGECAGARLGGDYRGCCLPCCVLATLSYLDRGCIAGRSEHERAVFRVTNVGAASNFMHARLVHWKGWEGGGGWCFSSDSIHKQDDPLTQATPRDEDVVRRRSRRSADGGDSKETTHLRCDWATVMTGSAQDAVGQRIHFRKQNVVEGSDVTSPAFGSRDSYI